MSVALAYPHIDKRDGEPARLQRVPRVRVAQIVLDHLAHGWSVEEMCRQHPYLTPAEAHAAMTYYFDHQAEIDAEIEEELRTVQAARTAAPPCSSPSVTISACAAQKPSRLSCTTVSGTLISFFMRIPPRLSVVVARQACEPTREIRHHLVKRAILLGIAGSFVGGFLATTLMGRQEQTAGWIGSIIGAIVLLFIYRLIVGRRTVV